jgi:uncharacterized protein (TIGR03000 family)
MYPGSGGQAPRPSGERVPAPKKTALEQSVRLMVNLPEDARLTVNGQPTTSTSSTRWFVSPPLPSDGGGYYDLRAEVVRNGRPVSENKRITVRPGEEANVVFDFPSAGQVSTR